MQEILFLCTGNYYRSRYAENLFNHEAARRGLAWRSFSRGLAIQLAPPGGLSPHASQRLREQGIPFKLTGPNPVQARERDFRRAARIVALKETEHRPLLARRHPAWENRIEYWEVGDLDTAPPMEALAAIEAHVMALIAELQGSGGSRKGARA